MSTSHLTLDQLVELREPGLEPGVSAARRHLESCPVCQAEAARLDQRSARLRALPALRPARDRWPVLRQQLERERRRRLVRRVAWIGLAAAAGFAAMIAVRFTRHAPARAEQMAIDEAMARSRQLEQLIRSYNPDARVTDGRTVRVAGELEDRIALVDEQLQAARALDARGHDAEMLDLWRQRVGLLNALVDVHMTRASAVGY
jgi:anti-sigma factor RsiW